MRFPAALVVMLIVQAVAADRLDPSAGSDPPVEIRLRGFVYVEPATMPFVVSVRPEADNRMLRVEADGDLMYRSSDVPLEGDREKRLHNFEFRGLPRGSYILRAMVLSTHDVRALAEQKVVVVSSSQSSAR